MEKNGAGNCNAYVKCEKCVKWNVCMNELITTTQATESVAALAFRRAVRLLMRLSVPSSSLIVNSGSYYIIIISHFQVVVPNSHYLLILI